MDRHPHPGLHVSLNDANNRTFTLEIGKNATVTETKWVLSKRSRAYMKPDQY